MIITRASQITCGSTQAQPPEIVDRESFPLAADMVPRPGLIPRGPAWRTDESEDPVNPGLMGGVWLAIGGFFAELRTSAWRNHLQVFPSNIDSSIDDWEVEYGLPDPCISSQSSLAARRAAVVTKFKDRGGVTPAYFICLARSVGYEIDIEEPRNFEFGASAFGDTNECSSLILQDYWVISVAGSTIRHFEFGVSQFGVDRLSDFSTALSLECLIRRQAPKFTIPIFNYGV